jgi:C4-type Zn-finger protein
VWVVEDGTITAYEGYFEDYRDELHKEIAYELDEEEKAAAARAQERAAAKAAGSRKK